MVRHNPDNQTGVALITVILITAMITSMTVALAISQTYSTQKVRNVLSKDRITLLLEEAEQLAASEIVKNRKRGERDEQALIQENTDEGNKDTELVLVSDELRIEATLRSLNAQFNLNNLDNALGARLVPGSAANVSASEPNNGQLQPGNAAGDLQSAMPSKNNTRTPIDSSPTARLCENTLNCEWWQYAPQGYVEENHTANVADATIGGDAPQSSPASGAAAATATPQVQTAGQTPGDTLDETGAPQSARTNAGQVQLSAQQIAQMRLTNLFNALDIDTNLIPALLDWIDEDSETRYPNGAEDDYYMNLEQPYRAANQGLASLRELLLIKGFDREIYAKLRPHLSIFPLATKINVNTASKEVLMSLSPFVDSGTAEMLLSARAVQAFQSVQAFLEHPLVRGRFVNQEGLSVDSDFYMLDADLFSERLTIKASSYMYYSNFNASTVKRAVGYVQ